jgi:hypothetical protein
MTRGASAAPAGVDLVAVLRWSAAERGLPVPLGLEIARRLADALGAASASTAPRLRGPSAVQLEPDGSIGIAEGDAGPGDPGYDPPERLRGEAADGRADLYVLGAILFELLAGRRLVVGGPPDGTPPDLGEERLDAPPQLVELIFELLCAAPSGRPRTAAEVSARLSTILGEVAGPEDSPDLAEIARRLGAAPEPPALAGPARALPARSGRRDAVVVALLLALSALAGWLLRVAVS